MNNIVRKLVSIQNLKLINLSVSVQRLDLEMLFSKKKLLNEEQNDINEATSYGLARKIVVDNYNYMQIDESTVTLFNRKLNVYKRLFITTDIQILLRWLNEDRLFEDTIKIAVFMHEFVQIHPDKPQLSRLLILFFLLKKDYQWAKYINMEALKIKECDMYSWITHFHMFLLNEQEQFRIQD